MDIVFIEDLQIDTVIGIYDWERKIRQTVSLDIEMATDIRKAAETDESMVVTELPKIRKERMPKGLDKMMTAQEFADLLEFLYTRR